jgi:hypothetical protein
VTGGSAIVPMLQRFGMIAITHESWLLSPGGDPAGSKELQLNQAFRALTR